jgi:hypothetical protein
MKKFVAFGVAFLSLSLSLSQIANAENVDARSVALGGTTLGQENGAFAPLRNPASMVDIGWGAFILPFSPVVNVGANTNSFNAFIPPGGPGTAPNSYINNLIDGFLKTPNARLEAQSVAPIVGFSGSPFGNLMIQGKPFAFGINLWAKASAFGNSTMSPGLATAVQKSSDLFDSFTKIQANSGTMTKTFQSLGTGSGIFPDFEKLNSNDSNQRSTGVSESENFQSKVLQPFINGVTALDQGSTKITDILTSLDVLSKEQQSGKGEVAADGHAVIALSGASRVFKNEMIDLSVGLNLKGFFFPANPAVVAVVPPESISGNPFLGALFSSQSSAKLFPVNVSSDLKLGPFKSITEIKNVLDTQLNPILKDAVTIAGIAKEMDQQLSSTITKARQSAAGQADVSNLNTSKTKIEVQATGVGVKLASAGTDFFSQTAQTIQSSLVNGLKDVKISLNQVSDVAPLGVGVDLGFQARIMEDIVLGLMLENPLVVWPSKTTTNDVTIDTVALSGSAVNTAGIFKVTPGATKDSNYNLTEPMALRFGGSYNLGKLTPVLSNAVFLADVEQVFNGRPFAIHLGFEKGWYFGPAGIFGRIGTQIGGLGNVVSLGLGFKGGPFNIDFGYGASNPFNPGGSNAATAALSTSLNF